MTTEAERAAQAAEEAERAKREATEAERSAEQAEQGAEQAAERAEEAAEEVELVAPVDDPVLDTGVRRIEAQVDEENPFGRPGKPLSRRSPFVIGFAGALGVAVAYGLAIALSDVRQVLLLILMAMFVAIGLDPVVSSLCRRGLGRSLAVTLVLLVALASFVGFLIGVVPPIAHQTTQLVKHAPTYLSKLDSNASFRRLDQQYHLVANLRRRANQGVSINAFGGIFGVGKAVLSALASTLTVVVLTIYFLANMPDIKATVYRLVPRTRRARVGLLGDEILGRIGGYVLGNLATSFVAGAATAVWLFAWGVPYPIALGVLIAIADLIPLVGATAGAVVVSLIALTHTVGTGIATAVFFLLYQQLENYLLVPRIMRRTVAVAPLVTVLAALLGAALLGILGALVAVPVAAAIQLVVSEVVYPRQDER